MVTAGLALWYLFHMKLIGPELRDCRFSWNISRRTLVLGLCSFLSQVSLVASMAAINNMIRRYGVLDSVFAQEQFAQIPMAVVGIVMKFFQIIISIVIGMAAGCIPIVGYNMGAGLKARVKSLLTILLPSAYWRWRSRKFFQSSLYCCSARRMKAFISCHCNLRRCSCGCQLSRCLNHAQTSCTGQYDSCSECDESGCSCSERWS